MLRQVKDRFRFVAVQASVDIGFGSDAFGIVDNERYLGADTAQSQMLRTHPEFNDGAGKEYTRLEGQIDGPKARD